MTAELRAQGRLLAVAGLVGLPGALLAWALGAAYLTPDPSGLFLACVSLVRSSASLRAAVLAGGSLWAASLALSLGRALHRAAGSRALAPRTASAVPWPPEHRETLRQAGLDGRALLFPSSVPDVRALGLLRPVVVVTTALLEILSSDELAAVLLHEAYHLRRRDPLRALAVRSLAWGFRWLPGLRAQVREFEVLEELAADAYAAHRRGRTHVLSALLKMATRPGGTILPLSSAFSDLLERRVAALTGRPTGPATEAARGRGLAAVAALGAVLALSSCAALHP